MNHHTQRKVAAQAGRGGFTLIEIVVALTVGLVLTGIAAMNSVGARAQYGISGAERAFGGLQARARAHAVERGETARFHVDASTDSVWVSTGTEVVDGINLRRAFGVDVVVEGTDLHVCFTPRGFANPTCSSSSGTQNVRFQRADRSRTLAILPLGQVQYP